MDVKSLNEYKQNCYTALSRDLTEFEKNFLLIAGAILAFSITFIKDIIKIAEADYLYLLFLGWLFIIVSIGIMMHTFLRSANASNDLLKLVDDFIENNGFYISETKLSSEHSKKIKTDVNAILYPCKSKLRAHRKFAVNTFLTGLVSFSLFVSLNLIDENGKDRNTKDKKSVHTIFTNDTIIIKGTNNE
ncbi:MAG: hypothetical protein JWR61_1315 [Ferruginibacter sp.]|uniref:hypothetical protein n=1 Tax=Ferruginibacter sp. TaxID=1940288 RepID=UPI002658CB62|nr:hypothetical protein [Ferruginibacter sp.]MDB5276360.1 hypothetical protein [Ferruginibacter sp.]